MKAERERRESILVAEGKKQSALLVAEGEKEATVLAAEANRLAKIKEAEGEAEALLTVQKALADSIAMLNDAAPSRAGHQAEIARSIQRRSRRQIDQDHHPERDPEPCGPCDFVQGSHHRPQGGEISIQTACCTLVQQAVFRSFLDSLTIRCYYN